MKKLILTLLLLALGVGISGTAFGDIVYSPQDPATYDFGIGLVNPDDPFTLNSVYVTSQTGGGPMRSDTFVFTFAAHMNAIFYNTESLHFNFVYDNSSLEVVGARPVSNSGIPWADNNYDDFQWPNPSSGFVSVSSLFQTMGTGTTFQPMNTSSIVPFFQVTLHVKSSQPSQVNFFGITQMTLVSHTFDLFLPPDVFAYFNGAVHEVPEPATVLLLGGCFAAVAGVAIRRRRKAAV